MQVNMLDAKNQLSKLVKAAENGANIVIARDGKPVARLVPYRTGGGLRGLGALKGPKGLKNIDAAFTPEVDAQVARLFLGD
jgi:prevent-host-death family protein